MLRRSSGISIKESIIATHIVTCILFICYMLVTVDAQYNAGLLIRIDGWISVILLIWCMKSWDAWSGRLFDCYGLFLIAAFLFHTGQTWVVLFGNNSYTLLDGKFQYSDVHTGLCMCLFGLLAMHLGALLEKFIRRAPAKGNGKQISSKALRITGLSFIIISFGPAVYLLYQYAFLSFTFGYGNAVLDYGSGLGTWPTVLAGFLLPGCMFIIAGSKDAKWGKSLGLFCIGILIFGSVIAGDRSGGLIPLIVLIWLWSRCISRVSTTAILVIIFALTFMVSPIIAQIRGASGSMRFSFDNIHSTYVDMGNPVEKALTEFGGSLQTVIYTLNFVPGTRPYDYGTGYLYSMLYALPNFVTGGSFDPTYGNPAQWLVETVNPIYAAKGGGMGFSFIAEAYLACGWLGVLLILPIWGIALARFSNLSLKKNSLVRVAISAIILSSLIHASRGIFGELIRPVLWYALIPYCFAVIIDQRIAKKHISFFSRALRAS